MKTFQGQFKIFMNIPENLKNKIPDYSSIDYTGVLVNIAEQSGIEESLKSKNKNIFVKSSMNIGFIEDYAESSMKPNRQQDQMKKDEFTETNYINFMQVIQKSKPIDIRSMIRTNHLSTLINHPVFNIIITLVILINTIFICIQTDDNISNKIPIVFQVVDALCVTIFTIEIALKLLEDPKKFWFSGWNDFDLIIVIFSYVSGSLTFITSFRILRIFRILKAFRFLKVLKTANKMLRINSRPSKTISLSDLFDALIKSSKGIFFVLFLIIIFLICAAFIAMNLFSAFSDYWFGSFSKTLWTLVIFLTADGWLDPYNDLVDAGQRYVAMVFIFIFIWIGAWILVNTLVGVATNSISSANKKSKEEEKLLSKKNKKKKNDENESKGNSDDDKYLTKKLTPPPFNADKCWESQTPLEIPRLDHINPDALIHLYLTVSLINQNIDEMEDLISQYQETVSEIINQQDTIVRSD